MNLNSVRIKILLIEDNTGNIRLIQQALAEIRDPVFELTSTERLSEGLKYLAQGGIDVVLLDLSLPDSQGLEAFTKTHAQSPEVPIIVLSGLEDEALAIEAMQRGAQDYLNKAHVLVNRAFLVRAVKYAIERKRVERELARLASFAERNPNPIVELDLTGVVTYLNAATRAQFPELPTEGSQHPLLQGLESATAALHDGEKSFFVREVMLGDRIYEEHISQLPELRRIRVYIADVTERKRAERLKDEFITTVSHELRTPLATIKEFTSILADGLAGSTTPDQRNYLEIVQDNADRMSRIIEDWLDMTKIEAGRVLLNKRFVDVRPLVEQVVKSLEPLANGKHLQITTQLPQTLLGIFADADKVSQVLVNLVSNAIKCTPEPGRVTIRVEELANEVQFRVEDTGIGIAPNDLPKLFMKFQQFRKSPSASHSKGTGLGLAICKRLVELHGGRIWAESHLEKGSTFYFTLPKYHLEEIFKEYLKTGVAQAEQKQTRFSILVVALAEFTQLKTRHGVEGMTQILKEVEQVVQDTVRRRAGDVVMRWQRGELIVILAEVDKAGCQAIMQRIQQIVEGRVYRVGQADERVRLLFSLATYPDDAKDEEELLRVAAERIRSVVRPQARALVVDDEPKIRLFLKEALEQRDIEVLTAASGPEALEQLKAQSVNLILLDLIMPVMDGYEVYHLLKENPRTKEIPVLILTGKGERTDRQLGMDSPTYHYITKPFELDELLAKVQELLQETARSTG